MTSLTTLHRLLPAFSLLIVAGCKVDRPTNVADSPAVLASVQVSAARTGGSLGAAPPSQLVTTGGIDPASVAQLSVQVDAVELHTPGSGWRRVDLPAPVRLDLMALPTAGAGAPLVLGTVAVVPGTCKARLFVSAPVIRFNRTIVVGQARFEAGVDYGIDLSIPSGQQTGLKAEGECAVPPGGTAATLVFDAGATAGTIVVTGSGKILVTPVVGLGGVSGLPGAATQIAVNAGDNQSAPVNTAVATPPSVIVRDQFNNPVSGVAVTFAVATGGGSLTGGSQTTNAAGIATVGRWTLGATAGANSLTATSTGLSGSPVTFTATGAAGAATQIAANAGDNQTAPGNTTVQIPPSVIVRDQFNNPVSGVAVTFAVAAGGGSVTGGNAPTNADGIATIGSWTLGQTAGVNTLTATAPGAGITGNPVTFAATGTAGAASQIAANAGDNQSAAVNTAVATPPSVIVRDQFNNPVSGVGVTFAVATGGGSITGDNQNTDAAGIATVGSWTLGPTAGPNTLTATSTGLSGSPVTFTATGSTGAATQIAANAGDNQSAAVNTSVATPPSVIVRDQFNNPVSGVAVTFAVATGGGSLTGGSQTTNAAGIATVGSWTLGPTAGPNTLTATSTGLSGSPVTFTATGSTGAATQIAVNAGDNQSAAVNTPVAIAPSVIVHDQFNNPVSGVAVTFAVATGGGSITGGSQTTDAAGIATVGSWTLGSAAGANTLTATSTGLSGSPVTFTATGTAGSATQIAANAGDNQAAAGNTAVQIPPSVIVRDQFNNPVGGVAVTFAVASGGGSVTGGNATTNADGIATIGSWTLGQTAGMNTLTATATGAGITGNPVTFTATGTAGAATQIAINAGDNQTAKVNTAVATPPSVVVRDQFNNPVSGVAVTFGVATGGGTLTGGSQTTNALGIATVVSWTLGSTAGPNTLTATSGSLSGSPVTFTATAFLVRPTIVWAAPVSGDWSDASKWNPARVPTAADSAVISVAGTYTVSSTADARAGYLAVGGSGAAPTVSITSGTFTVDTFVTFATGSTVDVQGGTLSVGAGTSGGSITVASGAVLEFTAGVHSLTATASVGGAGRVRVASVAVTFRGIYNLAGVTELVGTASFLTADTARTGTLMLSGGTLSGTAPVKVSQSFSWTGGKLQSVVVVSAGATWTLESTAGLALGGGRVDNAGVATWSGTGGITGGVINNLAGATFEPRSNAFFSGVFNNSGTFRKTAGTGTTLINSFNNSGATELQTGTLSVIQGTSGGSYAVASGAVLEFQGGSTGGNYSLTGTANLGGAGRVRVAGTGAATFRGSYNVTGVTEVTGFGTATFLTADTARTGTLTLSGSATNGLGVTGTAPVKVTSTFSWTSGRLQGVVVVPAGATWALGSPSLLVLDGGRVDNAGAATWSGTGGITGGHGGAINNLAGATFEAVSSASFQWNAVGTGPSFNNNGAFRKTTGTTTFGGSTTFQNNGTLDIQSGTLQFGGNFNHQDGGILQGRGTLNVSSGAFTNAGIVNPGSSPGVLSVTGNYPTSATSVLNIELRGTTAGTEYDRLAISGSTSLGGTLNVSLINGFTPAIGNEFVVTTFASRTGTFSSVVLPALGNGLKLDTVFTTTQLKLVVGSVSAASSIAINAGNNQSVTVNTAVVTPPSVIVRDQLNNPVSGVAVTFAVATGGGSITGANQITDAAGIATVGSWTLGLTAGPNTLTATATGSGITGNPVTFTATGVGGSLTLASMTSGAFQSCGLTPEGAGYCWGQNSIGQLGDGTTTTRLIPTAVSMPAGVSFDSVSSGYQHTCALTALGAAYCWGSNGGNLGDGTGTTRLTPVAVIMPAGVTFASITAGETGTCGLTPTGVAYCWGSNPQNGDALGTRLNPTTAVAMPAGVTVVSVTDGATYACALTTEGAVYCWGRNGGGQLGDGTTSEHLIPAVVTMPSGVTFASVTATSSGFLTCGLSTTGVVYCWGDNFFGQIGDGTTSSRLIPTAATMPSGVTFASVMAGSFHVCGLTPGGAAYCWGDNSAGELGDGTTTERDIPTPVTMPAGITFATLTAGNYFTCGLTPGGAAYCWGAGGMLGDGTTIDRLVPTPVVQP